MNISKCDLCGKIINIGDPFYEIKITAQNYPISESSSFRDRI